MNTDTTIYVINLSKIPFILRPVQHDDELVGTAVFHRKCIEYYAHWIGSKTCVYLPKGLCKIYFDPPPCDRRNLPPFRHYRRRQTQYSPCPYFVTGGFNMFRPRPEIIQKYGSDVIAWRAVKTPFGVGELVARKRGDDVVVEVVKDVAVPLVLTDEKRAFLKPALNIDMRGAELRAIVGIGFSHSYFADGYSGNINKIRGGKTICRCGVGGYFYREVAVLKEIRIGEKLEIQYIYSRCVRLCKYEYETEIYEPVIKNGVLVFEEVRV